MTISLAPPEVSTATPAQPARNSARGHAILFSLTVFLGAFLLFLIEPLFAKLILPWFGGSAAVWSSYLCFFLISLLFCFFYDGPVTSPPLPILPSSFYLWPVFARSLWLPHPAMSLCPA